MFPNSGKLSGLTIFITGASRGIGKAIALKAAKDGANIVVAARTAQATEELEGTIYTTAKEVEEAGGKCLPCIVDVSNEEQVKRAVVAAVEMFGGIDIVVNNAYVIFINSTELTEMEQFDQMFKVNVRATFLLTKLCLPYLKQSKHGHVLNICPPINLRPKWFEYKLGYTISKFGLSMCVLGMHKEFEEHGIAVNGLWPLTTVYTPSFASVLLDEDVVTLSRKVEIMSDAAYYILSQDPRKVTGRFYLDEEALREAGISDFEEYLCNSKHNEDLALDFFVEEEDVPYYSAAIKAKL